MILDLRLDYHKGSVFTLIPKTPLRGKAEEAVQDRGAYCRGARLGAATASITVKLQAYHSYHKNVQVIVARALKPTKVEFLLPGPDSFPASGPVYRPGWSTPLLACAAASGKVKNNFGDCPHRSLIRLNAAMKSQDST